METIEEELEVTLAVLMFERESKEGTFRLYPEIDKWEGKETYIRAAGEQNA